MHGSIDTNANRRKHPQGFSWTCCGENGATSRGCCDNRGSTLEELYASSEESENEASQDEDESDDEEGSEEEADPEEKGDVEDTGDDSDEDDEEGRGCHDGELEIDMEGGLWAVSYHMP